MTLPELASNAIPDAVLDLCERLAERGFRSWIVGGCIRDLLMGSTVSDWDLATDATPEQVTRTFRRTIPTGIAHGTVTVLHRGGHYELTTLRGEGAYSDGRRPDSVHFVSDIDEDLARRDFTVNAIAYDPRARKVVDPWGGVLDLDARRLRAVRDPHERFAEDGLRVLRAARFVATLELDLDPATEAAIPATIETFRKVSAERVRDEWAKAMTKALRPSRAFDVMRRTGILAVTAPSVAALDDDAYARASRRVDAAPRDFALRVAALLLEAPGDHDAWMRAMRASNEDRDLVVHLLRTVRLEGSDTWTDFDLRKWLTRVGRPRVEAALALARADARAHGDDLSLAEAFAARVRAEVGSGAPLAQGELAIAGRDVLEALQVRPGPHVGRILAALLERTLREPSLNERSTLLALLPGIARDVGAPEASS